MKLSNKLESRVFNISIKMLNWVEKRINKSKLKLERKENLFQLFTIIMNLDKTMEECNLILKDVKRKSTNDEILAMIDKYKPNGN